MVFAHYSSAQNARGSCRAPAGREREGGDEMTPRSALQQQRQKHRSRNGKYDKVNPCYICGKSAGENYFSDQRTDSLDSEGNEWGDQALCLYGRCCGKLAKLPDGQAFRVACGKEPAPWLKTVT